MTEAVTPLIGEVELRLLLPVPRLVDFTTARRSSSCVVVNKSTCLAVPSLLPKLLYARRTLGVFSFKDPGEAIRHQTIKLLGGVVYQIAVGEPYSVQQFPRLFTSINALNSSQDIGGGACEVSYLNTEQKIMAIMLRYLRHRLSWRIIRAQRLTVQAQLL